MTVTIGDQAYELCNDYSTDLGQRWFWNGRFPHCPNCHEALFLTSMPVAQVYTEKPGQTILECQCGWTAKVQE